ncbi:ferredoxin--NADP reductase [Nocardia puris]|uniref:3-ketosteroid 9alpha-monooxygenase subunit B n=1 Tax=Nocardia puris TaxID=208602 RepID=A0A366DUJ7_9NOCA|nr:ferredoxin--NADP reductase [Nocardia puris]RBO93757.1 3-ketosteroid 9alpha-monooxygenase subunit B [Nocardia puris]
MSLSLRIVEVVPETADAVSIRFEPVSGELPPYRAGQFLTLRLPCAEGAVARSYSLSSAPHEGGPWQVTVKRVAGGRGSNWLCDNAAEGLVLESLPPGGVFTPESDAEDLLLLAAGSGITPVLSILKSVLANGTGRCALVYANRDERSVIFARELAALTQAHADRFTVVHWLESGQGLPTPERLTALMAPWSRRPVFVCGPEPFMDAVGVAAGALGIERVCSERFVSMSADPFAALSTSADSAAASVEIDGITHEFAWPRERVLLDALLARGVDAPYSCREGACSACVCRVRDGEVKLLRNDVLEQEDLADGYVLACQAVPVTDTVRISYD